MRVNFELKGKLILELLFSEELQYLYLYKMDKISPTWFKKIILKRCISCLFISFSLGIICKWL